MSTRFVSRYALVLKSSSPPTLPSSPTLTYHLTRPSPVLSPTTHHHPLPLAAKPAKPSFVLGCNTGYPSRRPTFRRRVVMPSSFLFAEGVVKLSGPTSYCWQRASASKNTSIPGLFPARSQPSGLAWDPVACMNTRGPRLGIASTVGGWGLMGQGRPACQDWRVTASGSRDDHSMRDDTRQSTA